MNHISWLFYLISLFFTQGLFNYPKILVRNTYWRFHTIKAEFIRKTNYNGVFERSQLANQVTWETYPKCEGLVPFICS